MLRYDNRNSYSLLWCACYLSPRLMHQPTHLFFQHSLCLKDSHSYSLIFKICKSPPFFVSLGALPNGIRCKGKQDISITQENRQEKSQIKQNISLYLAKKGVSEYEYYKLSGTTRGVLGQNGISEDNISRFLAYAPDVNPEWLLTGRGSMLKSKSPLDDITPLGEPQSSFKDTKISDKQEINIRKTSKGIPLIPLEAVGRLSCSRQWRSVSGRLRTLLHPWVWGKGCKLPYPGFWRLYDATL